MEFWKKPQHRKIDKDHSRVMKLGNGQLLATVPREISRWKHIGKGTLLRWTDAGDGRILIEIVMDRV